MRQRLYRWGLVEKDVEHFDSGFHMWDHLPYAPPEIFEYLRKSHNLAHGMHILQQHGTHLDLFCFATEHGNHQVNNFYLNHKELFMLFTNKFYESLSTELFLLEKHKFIVPQNEIIGWGESIILSPRQLDCAQLLAEGIKTKDIARLLQLSPRTIETHIDILKNKFQAKNRVQLMNSLNKML
jgi:DNA-binding CsgD family transcriptional regulator